MATVRLHNATEGRAYYDRRKSEGKTSLLGVVGLAILSNSGDGARREEEGRYGYSKIFDPICCSHEIGFTKPDPSAYTAALRPMGPSPGEVLFDDNAPICVEGARQCGIAAILREDTLRAEVA